jgi:hypothetical protein
VTYRIAIGLGAMALGAVILLTPCRAYSATGLYLSWDECAGSPAAHSDLSSSCMSDAGGHSLYCAFVLPQPIDSVIAVEIVVDVQLSQTVLPAWWQFDTGGCRVGSLTASSDFTTNTACSDFWLGEATEGVPLVYTATEPRGGQNQARIVVPIALPSGHFRSLNAAAEYYAARLIFSNARTSACSGCSVPACLVLNSILIGRTPSAGGNFVLDVPGPGAANWARWQGGAGADCAAVPVRTTTWGQLKSLYR